MKKESYERITSLTYDGESQNLVWIDFGDELNFLTEIEDGDYFVYLHESNFNLSRKVQAELMERKEFQAVWWESGRGEGLGDFGEEELKAERQTKVKVRDGRIDDRTLMNCVDDLLDQCGWFQMYHHATVNFVDSFDWNGEKAFKIGVSE